MISQIKIYIENIKNNITSFKVCMYIIFKTFHIHLFNILNDRLTHTLTHTYIILITNTVGNR